MSTKSHPRIPFTDEEDILLVKLIQQYGTNDWKKISNHIPNRNSRQCKERWCNFLCPQLNKNPWTDAEDQLLLEKYQVFGPQWKKISTFFDRRSHIAVRNRMAMLKRHMNSSKSKISESSCSSPDIEENQGLNQDQKGFGEILNNFNKVESDPHEQEFSFIPYDPNIDLDQEIETTDFTTYRIQVRCSYPEFVEPILEF